MRHSGRRPDELRPLSIETQVNRYAEGSCLIRWGNTHVLCTATLEPRVPPFLKGKGEGWITAEYGMLPRSTHSRNQREAAKGKQSGRTQEIQRLIGRSLRAVVDLRALGENTLTIDCDVLQADGGTRTASITGGYVALCLAIQQMQKLGAFPTSPITSQVAALSCGIVNGTPVLDLDYEEDSNAQADVNFVLTADGRIIEIQGTAEQHPFTDTEFDQLRHLARLGVQQLATAQNQALGA